jgi:hypothetical protein
MFMTVSFSSAPPGVRTQCLSVSYSCCFCLRLFSRRVRVKVNERTGRPLSKKEIRDMAKKSKKTGK